jgi:hypothetical protein
MTATSGLPYWRPAPRTGTLGTMGGRRGSVVLAAIAAVALALPGVVGPPARAAEVPDAFRAPVPSGWNGRATGTAFHLGVDQGEVIYEDLIYDDHGANGRPGATRTGGAWGLQRPKGDYVYPTDRARFGDNGADLAELRFRRSGTDLEVLVRYNTLLAPDAAVTALAFGPPDSTAGAPHPWPFQANLSTPGTAHVVTLWGTGGAVDTTPLPGGAVAVDLDRNTVTARLPLASVGDGSRFTVYGGSGLWDPAAAHWLQLAAQATATAPGHGGSTSLTPTAVWNVAFRPNDGSIWGSDDQGDALKVPDISPYSAQIDLDAADTPRAPPLGLSMRTYRTQSAVGEGMAVADANAVTIRGLADLQGPAQLHFLGPDEISEVYVPENAHGVLVFLHGGGGNAGSSVDKPGIMRQLGDELGLALVSPLGRGPNGQWTDEAFKAGWDGVRDVQQLLGLPEESPVHVLGASMGGLGTFRFAVAMPDRFRTALPHVANTGDDTHNEDEATNAALGGTGGNGNPQHLIENLRNLPIMYVHGTSDEVEPYAEARLSWQTVRDSGFRTQLQSYPGLDHVTPILIDMWDEAARFALEHDAAPPTPPRVTFTMSESWWRPDLGLVFDHAYWVQGLRVRDTAEGFKALGRIDATTHGVGGTTPVVVADALRAGANTYPSTIEGQHWQAGTPIPQANALEASLTNLRLARFDLATAGLDPCSPVTLGLDTDGPATVELPGVDPASVTGAPARATPDGAAVDLPAGHSSVGAGGCSFVSSAVVPELRSAPAAVVAALLVGGLVVLQRRRRSA